MADRYGRPIWQTDMDSDDANSNAALANIDRFGCHVLHVQEDATGPCFTYSIGIERTARQPDMVVTGLPAETAHWIINEYNKRVAAGEVFQPNQLYGGFLDGFDVLFQPVLEQHYEDYFGWGRWLYNGNNFRVLQLVWPTTSNQWPWQDDAPAPYLEAQPLLGGADHPDLLTCTTHGPAHATYVCEHLVGAANVLWYSGEPDAENKWPDAWCKQCHVAYAAAGEWNDESTEAAGMDLRVLCHRCYDEARGRCDPHFV